MAGILGSMQHSPIGSSNGSRSSPRWWVLGFIFLGLSCDSRLSKGLPSPLRVEFTGDAGEPLADLLVELIDPQGKPIDVGARCVDASKLGTQPWVRRFKLPLLLRQKSSDESGVVEFLALDEFDGYVLRVSGLGVRPRILAIADLIEEPENVFSVTLESPGRLTCVLENLPADLPASTLLLARDVDRHGKAAEFRRLPIASQRSPSIDRLTPGLWSLHLEPSSKDPRLQPLVKSPIAEVQIAAGELTELSLDTSHWSPGSLRLNVRIGDVPARAKVGLSWLSTSYRVANWVSLDENGRILFPALLPGKYQVGLEIPSEESADSPTWKRHSVIEIWPGELYEDSFEFPRRRLRLQVTDKDGFPASDLRVNLGGDGWWSHAKTDAEGVIDLAFVPTDEVSSTVFHPSGSCMSELLGHARFTPGQDLLALEYVAQTLPCDPVKRRFPSLRPLSVR